MKKYPDHLPAIDELQEATGSEWLVFPVAPGFVSRPPQIKLQAMLLRIEANLAWRNSRPGEAARRLSEKITEEFVL